MQVVYKAWDALVFIESKISGSLDKPQYHNIDQKHPGPLGYIITQVLKEAPLEYIIIIFLPIFCCNIHNIGGYFALLGMWL